MTKTAIHKWTFLARFRAGAYSWKSSRLACQRLREAKRVMEMDSDFLPGYVTYASSVNALHSWGDEVPDASLTDVQEVMESVLARDPKFLEAWVTLGGSYLFAYRWDEAARTLARAEQLDPDSPLIAEERFYSLLAYLGRPADAALLLEKVIAVDPLALNNRSIYAEALATLGRLGEAETQFRRLLDLSPDYSTTYWRVAATYYLRLGRPAAAIPWYRQAHELDPENPWNVADIARALQDLRASESLQEARARLDDLDDDSPVVMTPRYNLARLNAETETAAMLREHLAGSVDRLVEGLHYVYSLEWLRSLQSSDPERALGIYRRIQPQLFETTPEVGPWNHGVALGLALLKAQTADDAGAKALARAALDVFGTTTEYYGYDTAPAVAWLIMGDHDRAMQALDEAFRNDRTRIMWSFLEIDPVYDPLRSRPEFRALLDYIRADMARQLEQYKAWEANDDRPMVLDFTDPPSP